MLLLNPRHLVRNYPDQRSREIMEKTVAFFEKKGLTKLKADYQRACLVRRTFWNSAKRKAFCRR